MPRLYLSFGEFWQIQAFRMNKNADMALSHGAALHGHPLFEDQRDDVRRRLEDIKRLEREAVRKRFEERREAWLRGSSWFSFGELADVYVSRLPIVGNRDPGLREFFELLRASIASGEFERGGRTRVFVISAEKAYCLTPELMKKGDGDDMHALLRECWTLPKIGIEWCDRLRIELPSRWKERAQVRPATPQQTKQTRASSDEAKIVAFIEATSSSSPMTQTCAEAILTVFRTQPNLILEYRKKPLRKAVADYCRSKSRGCPSDKTIYNVLKKIGIHEGA